VVPVAKAQHGKFYSGDSYIVLHTRQRGTALVWDLYFWLGKETSQDEVCAPCARSRARDESAARCERGNAPETRARDGVAEAAARRAKPAAASVQAWHAPADAPHLRVCARDPFLCRARSPPRSLPSRPSSGPGRGRRVQDGRARQPAGRRAHAVPRDPG
jgi:hypothetical protein